MSRMTAKLCELQMLLLVHALREEKVDQPLVGQSRSVGFPLEVVHHVGVKVERDGTAQLST